MIKNYLIYAPPEITAVKSAEDIKKELSDIYPDYKINITQSDPDNILKNFLEFISRDSDFHPVTFVKILFDKPVTDKNYVFLNKNDKTLVANL